MSEWERNPNPATLHALSAAYGWLGRVAAAAQAARRAEAIGAGLTAQEDLLAAATFAGVYAPAERGVPHARRAGSPVRRLGHYAVAALSAYQGRRRAGLAELDALRRELPAVATDAIYLGLRIDYLLGDGHPGAVWRELEALRAIDPRAAAQHAPELAWLGDGERAALLAADLPPDSLRAKTHAAIARWNRGETDAALEDLRAITDRMPASVWRLAPLYLYGDLAARAGRDREAIDALARFQAMYLPRMMWRSWAYPRSLVLVARSHERLGERDRAREALRKLFDAWEGAERDAPLLAEARALRARLDGRPVRPDRGALIRVRRPPPPPPRRRRASAAAPPAASRSPRPPRRRRRRARGRSRSSSPGSTGAAASAPTRAPARPRPARRAAPPRASVSERTSRCAFEPPNRTATFRDREELVDAARVVAARERGEPARHRQAHLADHPPVRPGVAGVRLERREHRPRVVVAPGAEEREERVHVVERVVRVGRVRAPGRRRARSNRPPTSWPSRWRRHRSAEASIISSDDLAVARPDPAVVERERRAGVAARRGGRARGARGCGTRSRCPAPTRGSSPRARRSPRRGAPASPSRARPRAPPTRPAAASSTARRPTSSARA